MLYRYHQDLSLTAITEIVAGFKVNGNGNYSVNNATLGVLVTDEAMQHHEMHKQYRFM
jgi:hypothetical protein